MWPSFRSNAIPLSIVQGILNRGIDNNKKNINDDEIDGEPLVASTDLRRKVHNYPAGY
jgi:hypothetical protein